MRLSLVRKYHKRLGRTRGLFRRNAVLTAGMALPFAVMPTTSLQNGLALSLAILCAVVSAMVAASLLADKVPGWLRTAICVNISMVAVLLLYPVVGLLSPQIYDSLGIYLPLTAVNTMVLVRTEAFGCNHRWYESALDGVTYSCGFAVVALILSALRELWGSGSLFGHVFAVAKFPAVLATFSGFLLLGLLAAASGALRRQLIKVLYLLENPRRRPAVGEEGQVEQ